MDGKVFYQDIEMHLLAIVAISSKLLLLLQVFTLIQLLLSYDHQSTQYHQIQDEWFFP